MTQKTIRTIYGIVLLIMVIAWWLGAMIIQENQPLSSGLGYYGRDTSMAMDYIVKDFEFIDQDSQKITRAFFENKVWVSDFFFSTCEGICPIMNGNLSIVQDSFINDTNVIFLSHTVDPDYDNPTVLKQYAGRFGAKQGKWHFVTGSKETIYDLARTSYYSAMPKDSSLGEDFVHSQLLCLIDPHLHIRGYYDGTNGRDMKKLIRDIKLLEIEYEITGVNKKTWSSYLEF